MFLEKHYRQQEESKNFCPLPYLCPARENPNLKSLQSQHIHLHRSQNNLYIETSNQKQPPCEISETTTKSPPRKKDQTIIKLSLRQSRRCPKSHIFMFCTPIFSPCEPQIPPKYQILPRDQKRSKLYAQKHTENPTNQSKCTKNGGKEAR